MQTYYLVRKQALMGDFIQAVRIAEPILVLRYGAAFTEGIITQTRQEFESLLFHLPYIGGAENPLTGSLIQSAWYLALYRVMKSYGKNVVETGELLYQIVEAAILKYPHLLNRLAGKMRFAGFSLSRLKKHAEQSQDAEYPEDWIYQVSEGDGVSFDFGIDYKRCAICEFYKAHDAEELLKYVCLLDFPISQAQGTGLVRTMSIGEGHDMCDFRFKDGREIAPAWPPRFKQ